MEWAEMTVADLAVQLQRRLIDARELTDFFIHRITAYRETSVFTTLTFDRARREAAESADRIRSGNARGLLEGIPITYKDLIDISGTSTTAGSDLYRNAPFAQFDACVVKNLKNAGMVCLGKTNLTEFAYSSLGLNPHYGTPRNPSSTQSGRVPGGSSSGAAVSVAAGLCPIAIGTDTGGSVRTPAAFNGLVGYKTSEGRISTSGIFPLSKTLDTVGVLARSVADCYLVDRALRGMQAHLPKCASSGDLSCLKLVVPSNDVFDDIEPDVFENFQATLDRLKRKGASIEHRYFTEITELRALTAKHGSITAAEAYWWHRELIESERAEKIDPNVRARLEGGRSMTAYDLVALSQGRREAASSLWGSIDSGFLAMPTVLHVAPLLQPLIDDAELFASTNLRTIKNPILGNLLDACCLAIPNGTGIEGMPTSLSICTSNGSEDRLLQAGLLMTMEGNFAFDSERADRSSRWRRHDLLSPSI